VARSDRYAEAFWWVVPIPALAVAAGGIAVVNPSPEGAIAAVLLALVGLAVEVRLWRTFRRHWAGDPAAHPAAGLPEPLRRPLELVMIFGALIAGVAWKARGLGESWFVSFLIPVGYIALLLTIGAIVHGVESIGYRQND
jgi:hypothetical protein